MAFGLSPYEEVALAGALDALGFTREDAPDGKIVESVHAVRLEVVELRDPAPGFLNLFHVLSREHVVLREVLLRAGDRYDQALADETRRNLAVLPQLSLVLVVAARGERADGVRLVVVTKDVWSLRLNWNAELAGGGLQSLTVNPSETSFLGTHQTLGFLFGWLPRSRSAGLRYDIPRTDAELAAHFEAGLSFDALSGDREGSFGGVEVGKPLRTAKDTQAWSARISWLDEVSRLYRDGRLAGFSLASGATCATSSPACVPWAWRTEIVDAEVYGKLSRGWAVKHDFALGFGVRTGRFRTPDLSPYDPATVRAFGTTRVPVSEDRVGPWVEWRTYRSDRLRVLDLETLALQEDHPLGPEAFVRFYPVLASLGSSRTILGLSTGAAYTIALGEGLARLSVEPLAELEAGSGRVRDGSVQANARVASPRFGAAAVRGRLVVDARVLARFENRLRRLSSVGGDGRLRGYPTSYRVGSNVLVANVEWRSRPVQLLRSVQLGGVGFLDAGDAADRLGSLSPRTSAGLGLRVLFPQLDRFVFRVDLGFPLGRPLPAGVAPAAVFATFGQAFSPAELAPRTAVTR